MLIKVAWRGVFGGGGGGGGGGIEGQAPNSDFLVKVLCEVCRTLCPSLGTSVI